MSFDQYISHPAPSDDPDAGPTLLIGADGRFDSDGHLSTVADRMVDVCQGQTLADGTSLEVAAEVAGLTHDFAKLTTWAQKHLRGLPYQQTDRYRYHAFPSALVTLYCLTRANGATSDYGAEVATLVVAGHHNRRAPPDAAELAENYGRMNDSEVEGTYRRVRDQFDDIDQNASERADRIIHRATDGEGSWNEFREWFDQQSTPVDGVHELLKTFARMDDGDHREGYYADVVRLWTAIKFADQTAASGLQDEHLVTSRPDRTALDRHVARLEEGDGILADLNDLRDQARTAVTDNVDAIIDTDEVGLITLPTGFGKTYAGLSAGLRAADICDSRLIYVLPYTSILDQTATEIQTIFDVSPYSEAFTLHHHLSETYTGLGEHYTDADIGRSPGALHAESWLSGLTLTTTVQLFESLTAPTARQATRVPALQNAVVVIDEPQAIPEDWWQIVPVLIELLVSRCDATVILMTATQPGLVQYGSEALDTQELTDNTDQYTDFLATHPRVTYHLHDSIREGAAAEPQIVDYPTASDRIATVAQQGRNVLAVCNTRASAEDLHRHVTTADRGGIESVEVGQRLHNHVTEAGTLPTPLELRRDVLEAVDQQGAERIAAFLSGNVRPDDRSLIIEALYDDEIGGTEDPPPLLDCAMPVVLVATSVVEAGVDISFDAVFRDYAPIPNIVQSGGRCNRSFEGETGDVIVWRLGIPERGSKIPSLVIHGGDGGEALPLLQATEQVLQRHATRDGKIDESTMVSETVSDFYALLFEGPLDPGDETLATAIREAAMSELEGEHMIEDIDGYDDVVACLTANERDALLNDDVGVEAISKHPGAQVTTDPATWTQEITPGGSRYLIVDAHRSAYDPVYGVR